MNVLVQELPNLLRHPFVLAIAAAVLTGVWVNGLTRRWQDRQKVLEVKTQLVASMSESTMKAILAVDRAADVLWPHSKPLTGEKTDKEGEFQVRPESPSAREWAEHREELWKATFDWERESAVIGTKLEAYFPVSPSSLYEKETIPAAWSSFRQNLSRWLTPDAMSEWSKCRESLLQEKAALIQEVLAGSAPSFGPRRLYRHRRTGRR